MRAVTFDLWQTLIHDDPEIEKQRMEWRAKHIGAILETSGLATSQETILTAHARLLDRMTSLWESDQDISNDEQVVEFLKLIHAAPNEAVFRQIARIYAEAALEFRPQFMPGAIEVAHQLKAMGLRLALISNTFRTPGRMLRSILDAAGMAVHFDTLLFSDEFRWRKPSIRIFRAALKALRVSPGEAIHVGDRLDADVAGAHGAGMRAVLADFGAPTPNDLGQTEAPDFAIRHLLELPKLVTSEVQVGE